MLEYELFKLQLRVKRLERWKKKAKKKMSDLQTQQDRLDKDIPILQQQEAAEAAQVAADQKTISDAQAAIADMTTQRDQLKASDAAGAARLTTQIDALEKLITVAQAPTPPSTSGASSGASGTTPAPSTTDTGTPIGAPSPPANAGGSTDGSTGGSTPPSTPGS